MCHNNYAIFLHGFSSHFEVFALPFEVMSPINPPVSIAATASLKNSLTFFYFSTWSVQRMLMCMILTTMRLTTITTLMTSRTTTLRVPLRVNPRKALFLVKVYQDWPNIDLWRTLGTYMRSSWWITTKTFGNHFFNIIWKKNKK